MSLKGKTKLQYCYKMPRSSLQHYSEFFNHTDQKTKMRFLSSVLCLALATTSVIRCDSDSSDSEGIGANGDSGVEDSVACRAIAQYLSGDVTAPADQSQLLDSFFNNFNFDIEAFLLSNSPELIVSNDFTFDIQVLRGNFEDFQIFLNSADVQPILGEFRAQFEAVVQSVEDATQIDRPLIRSQVNQLIVDFVDAIEPCDLKFGDTIRNLFEIDIFGQLVASEECRLGFAEALDFIAAANDTGGLRPDVLEINEDFIAIIPFAFGENYIDTTVSLLLRPVFFPFNSTADAAISVNDVFMTYIDSETLCGIPRIPAIVAIFDRLFNEQFLDFVIDTQGLEA